MTFTKIITPEAKFGCPSTRMNWHKTPRIVAIGKLMNKNGLYAFTYCNAPAVGCNRLTKESLNKKHTTKIKAERTIVASIDVVK